MKNREGKSLEGELNRIDWSANELVLPNDAKLLNPLWEEFKSRLQAGGWPDVSINKVSVAFTEAFNNAVFHGNKDKPDAKVFVTFNLAAEDLRTSVRDEGSGFSADEIAVPLSEENILRERGRGKFLMEQYSDGVEFNHVENGFEVRLHFLKNPLPNNEKR